MQIENIHQIPEIEKFKIRSEIRQIRSRRIPTIQATDRSKAKREDEEVKKPEEIWRSEPRHCRLGRELRRR